MREFLQALNEYPWTAGFVALFIIVILAELTEWRRG